MNVPSSIIRNNQKAGTPHLSINWRTKKGHVLPPHNRMSLSHKNKWRKSMPPHDELGRQYVARNKADTKSYRLYISLIANVQKRQIHRDRNTWWLPQDLGEMAKQVQDLFRGDDENIPEWDRGYSCKTSWMYWKPPNSTHFIRVYLMLCEFYLN